MNETSLNQALASMQLGQSVLVAEINNGMKIIKAQALEVESLKKQLEDGNKKIVQMACEFAEHRECEIEEATRQAGLGKIEEPIYNEASNGCKA